MDDIIFDEDYSLGSQDRQGLGVMVIPSFRLYCCRWSTPCRRPTAGDQLRFMQDDRAAARGGSVSDSVLKVQYSDGVESDKSLDTKAL